jgi:hypothetical protein
LDWIKSAQFERVEYRKIETVQWRMLLYEDAWPPDLLWLRQQFVSNWRTFVVHDQAGRGATPAHIDHALAASPRFYVAHERRLLLSVSGLSGWQSFVAPLLERLVGA